MFFDAKHHLKIATNWIQSALIQCSTENKKKSIEFAISHLEKAQKLLDKDTHPPTDFGFGINDSDSDFFHPKQQQ